MTQPVRPSYSSTDAIEALIRGTKLHAGVTFESLALSASSELDGLLGVRYKTPFNLDPLDPEHKSTAFWLQNVTSQLAAGRYLMASASGGSQETVNNYGRYLVENALGLVNQVVKGTTDLPALEDVNDHSGGQLTGATILNGDAYSQVDFYYENFEPFGIAPGELRRPPQGGATWPM